MSLLQKILLVILSFLMLGKAYTQSYSNHTGAYKPMYSSDSSHKKNRKNDIRAGLYFTRFTIAYDRFLSEKFSVGIEGQAHWSIFPGFQISGVGRYYFKNCKKASFFFEEKLTYGNYQPVVYDYIYVYYQDDPQLYGQHNANLNYFGSTSCIGFRVYTNNTFFMEIVTGIRKGILVGKSQGNMYVDGDATIISFLYDKETGASAPKSLFNSVGPGSPFCLNVRLGVRF